MLILPAEGIQSHIHFIVSTWHCHCKLQQHSQLISTTVGSDSQCIVFADLLQVQELPTWPAASTLLLRCMSTLGGPKGLQHSDASVRQISIDLLGVIATQLHKDMLSAEGDQEWLSQLMSLDGMSLICLCHSMIACLDQTSLDQTVHAL